MAAAGGASEPIVLFEKKGNIAVFTLNRPKAMNAVNAELSSQMEAHLDAFEADDDLWVGVIESSHPKTFSAGADLKAISKGESLESKKGGFAGLITYPRTKPLIAAVDGNALAGGCEIVLACDLVVATKRAVFGLPEVKRSLIPAAGGLFRLPRKIPRAVAMELMLTGDPISCERAYQLGLVNQICEGEGRDTVLEAALAMAGRIVVNAPLAVREVKACMDEFANTGLTDEAAMERSMRGVASLFMTPDFAEGPKAFVEKRPPRWTGRRSKL